MDKCKTGLGYNAVPPPYTGNYMPPKHDFVYPSLDDFVEVNESVSESVVEKPTVEINEPKIARKEDGAPIIEDWVSESKKEYVPKIKTVEIFNKPSFAKINFVKSTKQWNQPDSTSDELVTAEMAKERITKKRTKNEAKTTKPDSEWKSRKKTKSKSKPKPESQPKSTPKPKVKKNKFRD
ncbi:hypothetical protein Tco_1009912 [Tanacetum coccineum]